MNKQKWYDKLIELELNKINEAKAQKETDGKTNNS